MTLAGWWAELDKMSDYVYYHCKDKCPCSQNSKNAIEDAGTTAISTATDTVKWDDHSTRKHSALRHCIVSGIIAKRLNNCACAACIVDTRDLYQYYYEDQWIVSTQQAIYNDREGRGCAGCTGIDATGTPHVANPTGGGSKHGRWGTWPISEPRISTPESGIVDCCKSKLTNGDLATRDTGPGTENLPNIPKKPDTPKTPPQPVWINSTK